jgi:hypothetical protein
MMNRGGVWLLRGGGIVAAAGAIVVVVETKLSTWLAVPELATLEATVVVALGVTATSLAHRGRRAFQLDTWPRAPGWRGRLERLALLWCASLAAVLGVLPGLALDLGPPALWPIALVAVAMIVAWVVGAESPRRVAWLLCASYGLAATASLVVVRHVL